MCYNLPWVLQTPPDGYVSNYSDNESVREDTRPSKHLYVRQVLKNSFLTAVGKVRNGAAEEENHCRSDWPLYAGSTNHFPCPSGF